MSLFLFIILMVLWAAILAVFGLFARVAYDYKSYGYSAAFAAIVCLGYVAYILVLIDYFSAQ